MGSEKLGVDAIVDLAVDAIEAGREIAPALADGLQLTDAMVVIGNFNRLSRIVKNKAGRQIQGFTVLVMRRAIHPRAHSKGFERQTFRQFFSVTHHSLIYS